MMFRKHDPNQPHTGTIFKTQNAILERPLAPHHSANDLKYDSQVQLNIVLRNPLGPYKSTMMNLLQLGNVSLQVGDMNLYPETKNKQKKNNIYAQVQSFSLYLGTGLTKHCEQLIVCTTSTRKENLTKSAMAHWSLSAVLLLLNLLWAGISSRHKHGTTMTNEVWILHRNTSSQSVQQTSEWRKTTSTSSSSDDKTGQLFRSCLLFWLNVNRFISAVVVRWRW